MAKSKKETAPVVEVTSQDLKEYSESLASSDNAIKVAIVGAPKLTVVFPYLKEKAQGNELLYALRSMAKNFREDFNVVVIGDREDWFSDAITHIAAECISENPQIDTIAKLKTIICQENSVVSDKFVWANDDIYFISPVMLADIQILTTAGELEIVPNPKGIYQENRNKTVELLLNAGLEKLNFSTHTAFFFDKEKMVETFEMFPELNDTGLLISSMYYNQHFAGFQSMEVDGKTGNYSLRLISKNPDRQTFADLVKTKKFLNNAETGYSPLLVEYLETKFSEKSRFEI